MSEDEEMQMTGCFCDHRPSISLFLHESTKCRGLSRLHLMSLTWETASSDHFPFLAATAASSSCNSFVCCSLRVHKRLDMQLPPKPHYSHTKTDTEKN